MQYFDSGDWSVLFLQADIVGINEHYAIWIVSIKKHDLGSITFLLNCIQYLEFPEDRFGKKLKWE